MGCRSQREHTHTPLPQHQFTPHLHCTLSSRPPPPRSQHLVCERHLSNSFQLNPSLLHRSHSSFAPGSRLIRYNKRTTPSILRPMEGSLRRTPTWTRSTSSALPLTMASSEARLGWCSPRPQPYLSHSTSMGRRSQREHTHTPPTTPTHVSYPLHSLITFPSPTLTAD